MLSANDNELLTRTGPGTPMGDLFRRFWTPVLIATELPGPDCPPVRVGVLGEELVAFRDTNGAVGLIEGRCPHRQTELYWGRNEECGLRCIYHGWKFDVEGNCVDMPSEPAESQFRDKVGVAAYPTREWGGYIWAYMGPPDLPLPELPQFEWAHVPESHRYVSKKLQECNWAQSVEGAIDTAHFSFLHMLVDLPPDAPAALRYMKADGSPTFTLQPTEGGFVIGGARRAEVDSFYWRITQFLAPNHSLAPGAERGQNINGQTWVPIDDERCWVYTYTWNPDRPITEEELAIIKGGKASIHSVVDEQYRPIRNRANDYLIDREAQRTTSFTGVQGISEQDACVQDSQGRIYDRTKEHLGTTDVAIIEFRMMRMMLGMAYWVRNLLEGRQEPAAARNGWTRLLGALRRLDHEVAPRTTPFEAVAGPSSISSTSTTTPSGSASSPPSYETAPDRERSPMRCSSRCWRERARCPAGSTRPGPRQR